MVNINNLTTVFIDESFLKRVVQIVLKGENKEEGDLSIVLIGPNKIRGFNKKYRGKNTVTDVLSFTSSDNFPETAEKEMGEILICLAQVKKNAKKQNLDYNKELARVLIHGILHVLGYNHEKEGEAEKMEEKQEYYLSKTDF